MKNEQREAKVQFGGRELLDLHRISTPIKSPPRKNIEKLKKIIRNFYEEFYIEFMTNFIKNLLYPQENT